MLFVSMFTLPAISVSDAPVPPGLWPVPPGWWLLALLFFLSVLWLGYLFFRRFLYAFKTKYKRELPVRAQAMAALDELENRCSLDARETAYRLNEILRAVLFDAGDDAGRWPFAVRDGVIEDQGVWQRFWQELEMRYQPVMPAGTDDIERWLVLARGWVTKSKEGDALLSLGKL